MARIEFEDLQRSAEQLGDLFGIDREPDDAEAPIRWAEANDIEFDDVWKLAGYIAKAMAREMGISMPPPLWETFVASYGYSISLGIQAERDRGNRRDLPET